MMNIRVNGDGRTIDRPLISVADLLVLDHVEQPDMVSVQLNGRFLDKSAYPTTHIRENDEIDFLYFLGGGSDR